MFDGERGSGDWIAVLTGALFLLSASKLAKYGEASL
jgi:hypothetical protein